MPEYTRTELRWRCDFCSRDVKKGVNDPPGWLISYEFYGNSLVCCPDCTQAMVRFCTQEDLSFPLPDSLKGGSS